MKTIKKLFLIFGLVFIVGTTDAMHVNKSKKVTGKQNTGSKLVCAPKIKTQAPAKKTKELATQLKQVKKELAAQVKQVNQNDGKFPVIQENKRPAQVTTTLIEPTAEQLKYAKELAEQLKYAEELRE